MICGACKKEGQSALFTKVNTNKDGTRGLCKECKKERDARHRIRKEYEASKLLDFDLIPDLILRSNKPHVGVLVLDRITDRRRAKGFFNEQNVGLMAILKELQEPFEYCRAEQINNYNIILVSLTSVMDVENLIYTMELFGPAEVKAKVVIGGFGVLNIKLLLPYIDIAVFGRAEGQINEILEGKEFTNVWRKSQDPDLQGNYNVRQPSYLLPGEVSVGCRNKCKFCQYTWTRKAFNANQLYTPGKYTGAQETDWAGLKIEKAGRYTSAWDGWSEQTRLKVSKPIRDKDIINKFIEVDKQGILGTVFIKIFQIVGYPWETKESVLSDIEQMVKLLALIDSDIKTKVSIGFLLTPFGPEPLTPMQYDMANIYENWNENISQTHLYKGKNINAFIMPFTLGPFMLVKRVFIHRANATQLKEFKAIAFSGKLKLMAEKYRVPWLLKHSVIDKKMFQKVDSGAFDYLRIEG